MTSNDNDHRGLLPAGLADLLPPDAAREARAIDVAASPPSATSG
jgi:ATP phosphoribosyltransferase regulatory subunit